MKAIVLKVFRDARTRKWHTKGEVMEITEERFREMNSTRFGELVGKLTENAKSVTPGKDTSPTSGDAVEPVKADAEPGPSAATPERKNRRANP